MGFELSLGTYSEIAALARQVLLETIYRSQASHIGSSLSVIDLLVILVRDYVGKNEIDHASGNRLHISKGHAAAGYYSVCQVLGLLSKKELETYYSNGSRLGGHLDARDDIGIILSTGSLGHALPFAAGRAYAKKNLKHEDSFEFVILSDGELNEGSNWEALLFAAHHDLSRLVIMIDRNGIQSLDTTEATIRLEPLADKFRAFNFAVSEIDGHDFDEIKRSLDSAIDSANNGSSQPKVIICKTIKGSGVKFMENSVLWHYRAPNQEELLAARLELNQ